MTSPPPASLLSYHGNQVCGATLLHSLSYLYNRGHKPLGVQKLQNYLLQPTASAFVPPCLSHVKHRVRGQFGSCAMLAAIPAHARDLLCCMP